MGDGVEEILIFQRGVPVLEDVDNQGIIPILTLLSLAMIFSVATMKSITLRAILCGRFRAR